MISNRVRNVVSMLLLAGALMGEGAQAHAQEAVNVSVTIKNHRFQPAEIQAPANVPIILRVKNLDPAPMEFESVSLRVEKVVTANSEGIIRLRPLSPGRYNFFDDFNQEANGVLVVR
jgi:Cupredoxin-like domain